jgi:tRNA nucleotidyltransferase/poly(A) polymerase
MLKEIRNKLHEALKGTEFEHKTYFAGGFVRDELLGTQTKDIDITVELPEGGIRLAEYLHKQGLTTKPLIYKQFGTALIIWKDYRLELVMTRKESYRSRSRKPEVEFGNLREDVLRRDFTVNSLLMRVSDWEILDLSGNGLNDLKAKLIRATSDPVVMFKEDPLRILRAARFATTLCFTIEKQTLSTLKKMAPELKHISRERIAEEFLKIMHCDNFTEGLQLLVKTGIKQAILPTLRIPKQLMPTSSKAGADIGLNLMHSKINSLDLDEKLALLLWKHADPVPILKSLKLSTKDIGTIKRLLDICKAIRFLQKGNPDLTTIQLRSIAFWYSDLLEQIVGLLPITGMFIKADTYNSEKDLKLGKKLLKEADLLASKRFSLTGDDLIRTFCSEKGAWVGAMLIQAREYWFEHPDADKKELLDYLTQCNLKQ